MAVKSAEVQQSLCVAELEEANARLRVEHAAAHTKVAKVERRERTLSSDYDGLYKDFNDLRTSHAAVVQEKADLEKTEREKAQQFQNLQCKKLAELRRDTEESVAALGGLCEDFPTKDTTISNLLDWFQMEVQALPTAFDECN
jgi:predicted  nucleic acid-binding Zn-ribbon protein